MNNPCLFNYLIFCIYRNIDLHSFRWYLSGQSNQSHKINGAAAALPSKALSTLLSKWNETIMESDFDDDDEDGDDYSITRTYVLLQSMVQRTKDERMRFW